MRNTKKCGYRIGLYVLVLVILGGFTTVQAATKTLWGEAKTLGMGKARTFVMQNEKGQPVAIGIAFTAKALQGLPKEPAEPPETMLALPEKAHVPPFKYVAINWNPKGHEPEIYAVPHFDFHFYFMPNEERAKISADNQAQFAKTPEAKFLPADYMQAPGGIPRMGAHWVDKTAPELHGKPFTATFIYGTYDGKVTFLEPMVAMPFLKNRPIFSAPIRQPTAYERPGFYPSMYRVIYDKRRAEYRILLDELTAR